MMIHIMIGIMATPVPAIDHPISGTLCLRQGRFRLRHQAAHVRIKYALPNSLLDP